jgi:predicted transcriptional regulator YheO
MSSMNRTYEGAMSRLQGKGKGENRSAALASSAARKSQVNREWMFLALRPVARGIVQTFGDLCEVVLHDFSDPERSIVWIEGSVTKRKIGGSVSEIGLAAIRGGDKQEDLIGYVRNTKDGRILRSSTILLHDREGCSFGCLCINIDITDIAGFRKVIARLTPETDGMLPSVRFTDEIEEVLGRIVEEAVAEHGKPPGAMDRRERLDLIASLDRRGAFQIQRGVPTVAELLKVSRTTIYTYLDEIRGRGHGANGGKNGKRDAPDGQQGEAHGHITSADAP